MRNFANYRFFNSGSKVVAVSSFAGQTVKGVAKCNPNDEFNLECGKKLAAARCNVKVANKRYKYTVAKHQRAMKEFMKAQAYLMTTTDQLKNAGAELKEANADLTAMENSIKGSN